MSGLLPCPFCGGAAEIVGEFELDAVACQTCYARTDAFAGDGEHAASAWNRRAPADPALLALAKFGADVIASHRSPMGRWAQPSLLALPDIARDTGVTIGGQFAPGIAAAIARMVAPDGAESEATVCRWPKQGAVPRVTSCGQRIAFNLAADGEPCPACGGRIVEVADG